MIPNWKKLKTDQQFRARMEMRSRIIAAIRRFFSDAGFLEVETPVMVAHPGMEPYLSPFATIVETVDGRKVSAHLITSPEYAMKKLLAGGLPKIFEIARVFRNGEHWGGSHNPEFTMIEWYRADADYTAIMADTEQMVARAAQEVLGATTVVFRGEQIELAAPWERLTVREAMRRYADIDLDRAIIDEAWFRAEAESKGVTLTAGDTFDDVFFKIFLRDVEPKLGRQKPTILYDYPKSMAALARIKKDDPNYAERFEVYIAGLELGNAFSELNDATEQRRRLEEEQVYRAKLGKPRLEIDEQFLEAVGMMPDAAGIAFGVDRLVLLLTDAQDIRDVLFFPAAGIFPL